jgi:hypothetical protein
MKKKILIAIVVLIIAILVIAMLMFIGNFIEKFKTAPVISPTRGNLLLNATLNDTGVYTYNNATDIVGYALVNYKASNYSTLNISLNLYSKNPVFRIYLLNVTDYCYNCRNEGNLYNSLFYYLREYGLISNQSSFSYIDMNQLQNLQNNSLIIIPSGLMPITLMPNSQLQSNINIITLLNRGDTIFYIGRNFSYSVGLGGRTVYSTKGIVSNNLVNYGIMTAPYSLNSENLTTRNKTNYLGLYFDSPTFNFTGGGSDGQIAYLNAGNGSIVAFSNYETVGWNTTDEVAQDLAKVIYSRIWIHSSAYGSLNLNYSGINESRQGILTLQKPLNNSLNNITMIVNDSYPLAKIKANYNITYFKALNIPFKLRYKYNSTINISAFVGEGEPTLAIISINTNKKQQVISSIQVSDIDMNNVEDVPLSFFNISPAIYTVTKYVTFDIPQGTYIATLRNFNGSYYSSAVFMVPKLNITGITLNFQNKTFNFSVYSNGWPVSGIPYKASIDNKYNYSGYINNGIISFVLSNKTVIPYGDQTVDIEILGVHETGTVEYQQNVVHIPLLYIIFGAIAAAVIILNLVVKAPIRDEYYVDIETLPPSHKIEVTVKKDEIISIFDKVDLYYRWRYMPLAPEEIKGGISQNLKYENMPIAITLQNTIFVLNMLCAYGDVVNVENYYMPKSWIYLSGHDEVYLTIFRKLRDYCIANAMLFTDLGTSESNDMVITKNGISENIIIYSKENYRDINISENSRILLVFLNDIERLNFLDGLYLSYGKSAEILKMSINYGYIKLIDSNNLKEIIL